MAGARMPVTATFDSGSSFDLQAQPLINGTTDGTAIADFCIRFGINSTRVTLSVALVDEAGNASNVERVTVNRLGTLDRRGIDPGGPTIRPLE